MRSPLMLSSLVSASGAVRAAGLLGSAGREARMVCSAALLVTNGLFSGTKKNLPGPVEPPAVWSRDVDSMKLNWV